MIFDDWVKIMNDILKLEKIIINMIIYYQNFKNLILSFKDFVFILIF